MIAANPNQIMEEITTKSKKKLSDDELKAQVEKVMADKKAEAEKLAKELQADSSKFPAYAKNIQKIQNLQNKAEIWVSLLKTEWFLNLQKQLSKQNQIQFLTLLKLNSVTTLSLLQTDVQQVLCLMKS